MINYLAGLGWNDGTEKEIYTVEELVAAFRLDRVVKAPSMFDNARLRWMNGQHIRGLPPAKMQPLLEPVLAPLTNGKSTDALMAAVVANTQDKVELMEDATPIVTKVLSYDLFETLKSDEAKEMVDDNFAEIALALVNAYDAKELPTGAESDFDEKWAAFVKTVGKNLKRKGTQ